MPRGASPSTSTRRTTRARTASSPVVGQVTQLVAANETLKRENAELLAINEQLRAHMAEIGSALGRLTAGSGRRGQRGIEAAALTEARPRRQRKPITDPVLLERRRQALAKARAARAEKLTAARAEATTQE